LKKLPPRQLRERIGELAENLFRRLAAARPRVLFLEDMQWSDASSIELIELLLPLVQDVRLALVFAARSDQEPPMAGLVATIRDRFPSQILPIALTRLSETISSQLVGDLLGKHSLPSGLLSTISTRADGNPFFVEEIIRALIDRGEI